MSQTIINTQPNISKFLQVTASKGHSQGSPAITLIRAFDKKGEWQLEVLFEGGNKVTGSATAEFITGLESDLSDQGWQVSPSLFHRGFNARPGIEELTFVSGIESPRGTAKGLWADDYGLSEPTL